MRKREGSGAEQASLGVPAQQLGDAPVRGVPVSDRTLSRQGRRGPAGPEGRANEALPMRPAAVARVRTGRVAQARLISPGDRAAFPSDRYSFSRSEES